MSNMIKVIGELSEINNMPRVTESDMITIDKHGYELYIYPRSEMWSGVIFKLKTIVKILIKYDCDFYLSCARYGKPTIVVVSS